MLIKNFELELKHKVLYLDLEICNIQWDNNSIGWYEYWGSKEYDNQPNYVSEFTIDEIYIKNKKVTSQILFHALNNILIEDDNLLAEIEQIAKTDAKADKYERQIEAEKDRVYYE